MTRKMIVSVIAAAALLLPAALPAAAAQTEIRGVEFTFGSAPAADDVFTGTAAGSAAWEDDNIGDYFVFSGSELTVTSERKAVLAVINDTGSSDWFDMSADISVDAGGSQSESYQTGLAFGTGSNGYYQILFTASGELMLAKTDTMDTAMRGEVLAAAAVGETMTLDGTSYPLLVSLQDNDITVSVNGTALLEYTFDEDIAPGGFGFFTTRNMTAVYSGFKITKYEEYVPASESDYYPKNMSVYESYTRLGISWLNPAQPISSIQVLDAETGLAAQFDDTISLDPGAANNVFVTDLSSTVPSNYRIIFEFSDGHEPVEYVAGGLAYGKGTYYDYEQDTSNKIPDWDVFFNIPTATYGSVPAYIQVDRDEKYSGNSSAKFTGSYAIDYDNDFYQLRISALTAYDPSYTYRVSMKVKYTNAKDSVILVYANRAMNSYADGTSDPRYGVGTNLTPKDSSDGWEDVSFIMEPQTDQGIPRESGKEFAVRILSTAEAFWIDDIEMVPIDENGNDIGENILPNSSLEADDNDPCGNVRVDTVNTSLMNGTASLSWENPNDAQLKSIRIYREINGELCECAFLSSSTSSIDIGNISSQSESERFIIKTVDTADNVSSGASIELSPEFDDCVYGNIVFSSGGTVLDDIPEGFEGNVTASISVTNHALDDFSGCLAVAAYQDGVLKSVSVSPEAWFRQGAGETQVSANVSVASGSGWQIKAFLLDDIINMKLLTDEAEI